MNATVRQLHPAPAAAITTAEAAALYLAHVRATRARRTWEAYTATLGELSAAFGATPLTVLDAGRVAAWFTGRWDGAAPSTWNAARAALTSAAAWWHDQRLIPPDGDPFSRIGRRAAPPDRSRALSRDTVAALLSSPRVPLRERCLWSMLLDTAARSGEVLALDVPDLDLPARRARVRRKGGAADVIIWRTRTARLLTRYLAGRSDGPVFLTSRAAKADVAPGPADRDARGRARLSYERAETLFRAWTADLTGRRATLHQLRHTALTADAEDGASLPLLMTKSGHVSIRSLARYARPGPDALAAWQDRTDDIRRSRA